jgi:hypothetical protein
MSVSVLYNCQGSFLIKYSSYDKSEKIVEIEDKHQ